MNDVQLTTTVFTILLGVLLFIDVVAVYCLQKKDNPHSGSYRWAIGFCTVFILIIIAAIGGINAR